MTDPRSSLFAQVAQANHEQVHFCRDADSGLHAIVAIHSTALGPALGGCRMYPYQSEQAAITDVLRLSQGMTMKAAISGLPLGGGKAVILADPKRDKSEALWSAFGRFVDGLAGRYITAEDVGTSLQDMACVRAQTRHVVGVPPSMGGSGDPSPVTALGVFSGLQAALQHAYGSKECVGRHVAVQGCGHVGGQLIRLLVEAGAKVTACDIDEKAVAQLVRELGIAQVAPADIYRLPCDVFAPCAMGASLNVGTVGQLQCRVVAGAANNQLADEEADGARLAARGILYAPDFAINAGGLINVFHELGGYDAERALAQTRRIYEVTGQIFAYGQQHGLTPAAAGRALATARLRQGGGAPKQRLQASADAGPQAGAGLRRVG